MSRAGWVVHHTFIQDNEILVEICDDDGGRSFKMPYQIANVQNPNSTNNTIVFSIFEAKDYRSNMKIGLTQFRGKVKALQSMTWK